jgi:translation initiation factor 2B subunit (eIF-2B alpha/beta/delta family)
MGFDSLKADNLSGASEVLLHTAQYWLEEIQDMQPSSLRRGMTTIRHRGLFIIRLYPRMAPLFHLVNNVLLNCAKAASVGELVDLAQEAIEHTINKTRLDIFQIIPAARTIIKHDMTIFTYSRSSVILAILKELKRSSWNFKVMLTEGRPMNEGLRVAKELADDNIDVTVLVDAAMKRAVAECDLILIGADTFSEERVVNKIGTYAIALLARESKKPVYCFTTSNKYLPPNVNQPREDNHDPTEVWPEAIKGITIKNTYFESIPMELITDVITELGPFKPAALSVLFDLPVDEWLREQF